MNKFIFKLGFALLFITLMILPGYLNAQTQYIPLEPLPGTLVQNGSCDPNNPFIPDPNNPSNTIPNPNCATDISGFVPAVFTLLIALAGGLAVIMIVIGGFQYLSTDAVSGKSEGKERIQNAILGLLLAIASYMILNTLNPQILDFNLTVQNVGSTIRSATSTAPTPLPPTSSTTPTACNITPANACAKNSCLSVCPIGVPWIQGNDAQIRSMLAPKITVNNSNCQTVGDSGCTSLTYLPQRSISGLQWLARNCGSSCSITITGGTEFWAHTSHGPGVNRVDLRLSPLLDNFIKKGTKLTTNSCYPGQPAWGINGSTYVLENGNHWHVCY